MQLSSLLSATTGITSTFPSPSVAATRLRTLLGQDGGIRPIWAPLPGPQTAAFFSLADELFYGGAGGGGKTDLIIGLATTSHTNTAIFRREFKQFQGADGIAARVSAIVGDRGNCLASFARNIDGKRFVEYCAMQFEADKNKYKGRPHDLKAFDEIPEFSESQYRFAIAWLRTADPHQRCRVVVTGNPPTDPEGEWVIKYWGPWLDKTHPNPAAPGELRWFAPIGGGGSDVELPNAEPVQNEKGEWIKPRSRTFIPASVEDNPYYMATGYDTVLDNLPEPLRSQMRFGDFTATSDDHPRQVIPTAWVKAAQARWKVDGKPSEVLSQVGCDPSRGGKDKFCITLRYDNWVAPVVKHSAKEAPDGAAGAMLIADAMMKAQSEDTGIPCTDLDHLNKNVPVGIDIIGSAGSSVFDHALAFDLKAAALNGAEKSQARDKTRKLTFFNKRAEWHWRVREYLDPTSGMDIAIPPDREILVDLCAPRWQMTPRGIKVEKKDEIKARIGRSPDVGESVIYCLADTDPIGMNVLKMLQEEEREFKRNDREMNPEEPIEEEPPVSVFTRAASAEWKPEDYA